MLDIKVSRVILGFFFFNRGVWFLGFFAVIFLLWRFEIVVWLSLVLDSIVWEPCSWALSVLRFYFECDRVIWWLLGVFGIWIYLGYEYCPLDFVEFLLFFGLWGLLGLLGLLALFSSLNLLYLFVWSRQEGLLLRLMNTPRRQGAWDTKCGKDGGMCVTWARTS